MYENIDWIPPPTLYTLDGPVANLDSSTHVYAEPFVIEIKNVKPYNPNVQMIPPPIILHSRPETYDDESSDVSLTVDQEERQRSQSKRICTTIKIIFIAFIALGLLITILVCDLMRIM